MSLDLSRVKIDKSKLGFFRYKKLGKKYLLTNIVGRFAFLKPDEFKDFLEGKLDKHSVLYKDLLEKGFIKGGINEDKLSEEYHQRKNFLYHGPSLHIIVVTLRCNFKCIYCQASSTSLDKKGFDMTQETAKKVVDTIFEAPSPGITIEFQGGEPLVNWPIIQYIVKYAEEKNKKAHKDILFSLVSNLSLMTDDKYDFIKKHHISVCTSLDGPEKLHNKNRPYPGYNSYKVTTAWIQKMRKAEKKDKSLYRLSALLTVSRFSLKYPKQIVDEYLKWGFTGIHLRPLSNLGLSARFHKQIGYTVDEFLKFWKKAMDYIIKINLSGKWFFERGTAIMLEQILTDKAPNFVDLRSPCGAGIGQLLYNYNGKVYTCDEARMLGDDTFLLGNVNKDSYKDIIMSPNLKAVVQASILENLPVDYDAYEPYTGVCPVLNYAMYGDLFASTINNDVNKLHEGMLDYIFEKLEDENAKKVFDQWVGFQTKKRLTKTSLKSKK